MKTITYSVYFPDPDMDPIPLGRWMANRKRRWSSVWWDQEQKRLVVTVRFKR